MSSANNQVFGNDVSVIDSTQVYPLGTERLVLGSQTGKGDQVWRYVYNSTAAAFTEGQVVTAILAGEGILICTEAPAQGCVSAGAV